MCWHKIFSLVTHNKDLDIIENIESVERTKGDNKKLLKKFKRNKDLVFELPTLKVVIAEKEGNRKIDGQLFYQVQKLRTIGQQKNTLQIIVAFWLYRSSNATMIDTGLRMTLRMLMETQITIWFSKFTKFWSQLHFHYAQIMLTTKNKFCTFSWTGYLMCTTIFQPSIFSKTCGKNTYSMDTWIPFNTVRGTWVLRRLTGSNFGTKFWCYARTRKNSVMPVWSWRLFCVHLSPEQHWSNSSVNWG